MRYVDWVREYVTLRLPEILEEERVEPPKWINEMIKDIVESVIEKELRFRRDIDYEIRRAVWTLKEVRSEIEDLKQVSKQ